MLYGFIKYCLITNKYNTSTINFNSIIRNCLSFRNIKCYGYTTTGEVKEEISMANDLAEVDIVNNKGTEINVGVTLDNLPYVFTLVMALGGLVVFVLRKRIFN